MGEPQRGPNVAAPRRHRAPRLLIPTERAGLRATWHREDDEFVLSMWHGDECVATTPLSPSAAAELSSFLVSHLGDRGTWMPRVVRQDESRQDGPRSEPVATVGPQRHGSRLGTWLATARRRFGALGG